MGQIEVYEWLKTQRESGKDEYFTVDEVKKGMSENGASSRQREGVAGHLVKLRAFGYVENEMTKDWRNWKMKFRVKEEYVKHG